MKKINRLTKNWEFNEVIASKNQIVNKFLIVYYQRSNSLKVGLTVPKKFANAVKRNYYKRQLRAILQICEIQDLNLKIVIIVRKEFIETDYATKKQAIINLFEKFKNEKIKSL